MTCFQKRFSRLYLNNCARKLLFTVTKMLSKETVVSFFPCAAHQFIELPSRLDGGGCIAFSCRAVDDTRWLCKAIRFRVCFPLRPLGHVAAKKRPPPPPPPLLVLEASPEHRLATRQSGQGGPGRTRARSLGLPAERKG